MDNIHFPYRLESIMSRAYDAKTSIKLHHLLVPRLIGYLAPLFIFVVTWQWFKPQDETGWVAAGGAVIVSMIIPLATLSQARSEAHRRPLPRGEVDLSLDEALTHEAGFAGPEGKMDMDQFLVTQP